MKVIVCDNYESQCAAGADIIEKIVREKPDCCLGLATGSSPVGMYKELSRRCREEGLEPIVCSAYRTEKTPTRLYRNKVARLRAAGSSREAAEEEAARWVAPPGTSEHQTGLALDIVSLDYQLLDEAQAQTPEQKWLMENSWKYGFILRYPSDKEEITGIGYEPWHYRYVGREAAAAMHQTGQCLEEYLKADRPAETLVPAEVQTKKL